jgi:hypothetical protein
MLAIDISGVSRLNGHAKNSSSLCLFREFDYYRGIVAGGVDDAQIEFGV